MPVTVTVETNSLARSLEALREATANSARFQSEGSFIDATAAKLKILYFGAVEDLTGAGGDDDHRVPRCVVRIPTDSEEDLELVNNRDLFLTSTLFWTMELATPGTYLDGDGNLDMNKIQDAYLWFLNAVGIIRKEIVDNCLQDTGGTYLSGLIDFPILTIGWNDPREHNGVESWIAHAAVRFQGNL